MSWARAKVEVLGGQAAPDSIELRNDFIVSCMIDEKGQSFSQHEIHKAMQRSVFEWDRRGYNKGVITCPPDSGKSQQFPVGLATYFQTRWPWMQQLIITADDALAKKRLRAIRMLVESEEYRGWCKKHNIVPLRYSGNDNDSSKQIYFESKNRSGNPSIEGYSVLSNTSGQRVHTLWFDDICTTKDKNRQSHREDVWDKVSNIWVKRVHPPKRIYSLRTKWHPNDANSRLIKSGRYCILNILIRSDMSGYSLKEWIPDYEADT